MIGPRIERCSGIPDSNNIIQSGKEQLEDFKGSFLTNSLRILKTTIGDGSTVHAEACPV